MQCPKCRFENREKVKFCEGCGARLELIYPECRAAVPLDRNFCGECGHDLRESKEAPRIDYDQPRSYTPKFLAEKILTSRSAMEGERKLVTVLFADVAGFTPMSERLDPEDVHEIMDGCFRLLMDEIHRFEGTVNEFRGDGLMALFGAPIAHEDHAQRACHAALAIQEGLAPYAERLRREYGIEFKMRIGLNSGPVVVGAIGDDLRMDYTAQGDTANLAARMESAAGPGGVLVSEHTYALAKDFFQLKSVGQINLKGKEEPQVAYELAGPTDIETRIEASVARGLKELVGRDDALESLFRAFGRAKRGEAQVIDVVGEAGIGKSRLVYEFEKAFSDEATFLRGVCVQYGRNVNFLPVIDIVRAAFGIVVGMAEEEVEDRIAQKAINGLASMIPFYRNLLSLPVDDPVFKMLDAEGRKYGKFEAVKNLLLAISAEKPLVVFLEDVHWIDKISEDLFTFFSRCIIDHPILMLSAYRPEGSPPWAHGAHYHRLGLETLSAKASIRLVRNMVGGLPLDSDLEQKIVAQTGGNPFFVEEIVRALLDSGDIVKKNDGYVCHKPIDQLKIPDTIQGVLAARMDRLSEDLKQTMQVASVIGRDFAFRILKSIMEVGEELRTHLTNLVGLEVLYEKCLYPELEYIFKHALTQEVAYESLLKQRRKEIHGRIAQAIEELYGGRLEEHYEVLAYHYERSEKVMESVNYLMLAGEKSIQHNAFQAATEFFQKAFQVVEKHGLVLDPEQELRLHRGLGRARISIGAVDKGGKDLRKAAELSRQYGMIDYERKTLRQLAMVAPVLPFRTESEQLLQAGLVRAREIGDKSLESTILSWMGFCLAMYGEPNTGHQLILDAERTAMESGKPHPMFFARLARAGTERWVGRPGKSVELTEGMVEALRNMFSVANLTALIFTRAVALAEIGKIENGMALLREGIDISEKYGVLFRLATLYNCLGYCYSEIHHHGTARKMNFRSDEIARKLKKENPMGSRLYAEMVAQANVNLMENLFDLGEINEAWNGVEYLREEAESEVYDMLRHQWESRMNYLQARIFLSQNDLDRAEKFIRENLVSTQTRNTKKREGGFTRLLGEVHMRRGQSDAAFENLNNAIDILKEVGNPRQLWQAHNSLAMAFDQLGRSSEAREQWGAAAEVIQNVANGLSDRELREGFLNADAIRQILSKVQ